MSVCVGWGIPEGVVVVFHARLRGWMMRAFLRSSEGCFQLKPHTTTIGQHEGSDIVLKVGARKLSGVNGWWFGSRE